MTDTPRTDVISFRWDTPKPGVREVVDADDARQLERELAEAREHIKGYEAQAQSFYEEYRRKCDFDPNELKERLSDTQHRNGANIVRLQRAEAHLAEARAELAEARKGAERVVPFSAITYAISLMEVEGNCEKSLQYLRAVEDKHAAIAAAQGEGK